VEPKKETMCAEPETGAHVMVDLETMSLSPSAAIVQIGATAFDRYGIRSSFFQKVDLQSCAEVGLDIDASTVLWWMQQEDKARELIYNSDGTTPLVSALGKFSEWFAESGGREVWGNGATFDNVVLRNAYRTCGLRAPWSYKHDRCFRTIKAQSPAVHVDPVGTKHMALDDATYQTKYLLLLNETHFKGELL